MSQLIKFYRDEYPVNDSYFSDIVYNWNDYNFETDTNWISWLFPSYSRSKYNPDNPVLTDKVVNIFKCDKNIRINVFRATLRLLLFFGFILENNNVKQVSPLKRNENGQNIGLYSIHNYTHITRIMKFLELINMTYLSSIFFLAMIRAITIDHELKKLVLSQNSLYHWMNTQLYLTPYSTTYSIYN